MLESVFNTVAGLAPILKNICDRMILQQQSHHSLLLICFTLYSAPSSSSSLLLLIISPIFAFGSNLKGFREFKSGFLFSLKSLSLLLFSFSLFFLFSSVLFHYFLLLLTKRILLSWELIKMFLRPWRMTSLKYVHVNK